MLKGTALTTPKNKSETAIDATNMFGILRIRLYNNITRSVKEFPTNRNNNISMYKPDSSITLALLLDFKSLNISVSWFSVESIFCLSNSSCWIKDTLRVIKVFKIGILPRRRIQNRLPTADD